MKNISLSVLLATLLAGAALPVAAAPEGGVPAAIVAETVRIDAEVLKIDAPTRLLTLKLPNGEVVEVVAGEAVRNLPQVRAGDHVLAEYQQALAMKLKKGPGVRSTTEKADGARAKAGEKPAGVAVREIDFVADVTEVDRKTGMVTILGAKGRTVKLQVQDKKVLAEIKKGDQVEGTYIQALAVAVVPKTASK